MTEREAGMILKKDGSDESDPYVWDCRVEMLFAMTL
jgi:hypothetical protein